MFVWCQRVLHFAESVTYTSVLYLGSIVVPSDAPLGECSSEFPPADGSTGSIIATPVPEPATLGLVGLGVLALAAVRRRT